MAVVLLASAPSYEGLSSDTKPVDASVVAGAKFTELDTGFVFQYGGGGQWLNITPTTIADGRHQDDLAAWQGITDELFRIRRVLEEANGLSADDLI